MPILKSNALLAAPMVLICWSIIALAADSSISKTKAQFRRPIAAVLLEADGILAVANRRSGTISLVNLKDGAIANEVSVGKRLSDLTALPKSARFLASDEKSHELLLLKYDQKNISVESRLRVNPYPIRIISNSQGSRCFVTSLWSRRLSVVEIAATDDSNVRPTMKTVREIALPFAPRELLLLDGDAKLVVADAFGGQLAIINVETYEIESVRNLPTHNIRGLAVGDDGSRLLVSQQILNSLAHSSKEDVHWGLLMTNCVRSIPMKNVLDPKAKLLKNSQLALLGNAGNGAGDPAGFVLDNDERLIVALAGTNEVAIGRIGELYADRVDVGRRPTDIILNANRDRAYVLNTFSDSVSVLDLSSRTVTKQISLGPMPTPTAIDRGEMLFSSARLAHDNWMSCHSCHTNGHTNGLLADTQGDGSFGAPKRVLSLLGTSETKPWAWNGSMPHLAAQIHKSVQTTMRGQPIPDEDVSDLIAYIETLAPPPTDSVLDGSVAKSAVNRGNQVFANQGCAKCHAAPRYTSKATYDVGLSDELGNRKFNPPSLRGVRHRSAYFHDLRAKSLKDVFTRHRHQVVLPLSDDQLSDLVTFLRSL